MLLTFGAPEWASQTITFVLILGFPVAMLLAWAYKLTPEGVKRTKSVPLAESITHVTGRKLDIVIIGLMAVRIAFLVVDNYVVEETSETEIVADESVEA